MEISGGTCTEVVIIKMIRNKPEVRFIYWQEDKLALRKFHRELTPVIRYLLRNSP